MKEMRLLLVRVNNCGQKTRRGKLTSANKWVGEEVLVFQTKDKRDYVLAIVGEDGHADRINKRWCTILQDHGTDPDRIKIVLDLTPRPTPRTMLLADEVMKIVDAAQKKLDQHKPEIESDVLLNGGCGSQDSSVNMNQELASAPVIESPVRTNSLIKRIRNMFKKTVTVKYVKINRMYYDSKPAKNELWINDGQQLFIVGADGERIFCSAARHSAINLPVIGLVVIEPMINITSNVEISHLIKPSSFEMRISNAKH